MVALTDNDVKILKFIKRHQPTSLKDIEHAMSKVSSIQYRVEELATHDRKYFQNFSIPIDNTSYIEEDYENVKDEATGITHTKPLGLYSLSEFGEKALQDYEFEALLRRKELWLKNAWIPILVTVVTNLAISGIKWLLPLIQGWFSSSR